MRKLYRFGPFELETQRFELCREGTRQPLSASLTKLLILFVDRPTELITRDAIAACLWKHPQYVDAASGINTAVNRLRTALGDDPSKPVYIETVVGLGYRFIARVERTLDEGPEDSEAPASPFLPVQSGSASAVAMVGGAAVQTEDQRLLGAIRPGVTLPKIGMREGNPSTDPSADAEPSVRLSRKSLYRRLGILGATLTIIALTGRVVAHRLRTSTGQTGVFSPDSLQSRRFVQLTLNDGDNRVSAESLSHSGKKIAVSDHDGLSVRDLDSGAIQLLGLPSALHISRVTWYPGDEQLLVSGRYFAEKQNSRPELEVWLVSLRGEQSRLLLKDASEAVASPDGKYLAYLAHWGTEIWIAGALGESPRRLGPGIANTIFSSLIWGPRGGRLVYQSCRTPGTSGVSFEDAQGSYQCDYQSLDLQGKVLATERNLRFDSAYELFDGSMCFPQNDLVQDRDNPRLMIVKTDPDDGHFLTKPRVLGIFRGDLVAGVSASDDGTQIAALVERRSSDVYVGDIRFPKAHLERVHRLVHPAPENYPHSWTPASDAVIFESNDLDDYAIYKQKVDGTAATLIARAPQNGALPQVAPGGDWIMFENFTSLSGPRSRSLFRVPLNGGKLRQVTTHGQLDDFSCSVGARGICVLREKIGSELVFFSLDPVLGQGGEVGRTPWIENSLGDWSVSPDGTTIAMPVHSSEENIIRLVKLGKPGLSNTLDISVPNTGTLLETSWAPGSGGFYVESKTYTGFALLYVDPQGHSTVLRNTHDMTWGVPSPNGKELGFVEQTTNTNVWIAERNGSQK